MFDCYLTILTSTLYHIYEFKPFHDKRGGSIVPEKFSNQRPPLHVGQGEPRTPPGSPPHDPYDSHSPIEGGGAAAFTGSRSPSPPWSPRKIIDSKLLSLGQKRALGTPPLDAKEPKRLKETEPDDKSKPQPPSAHPSSHARPPPPKRPSSSAPPKPTPQKPPAPKPAPPKRQNSNQATQAQKQTPHKPGIPTKPAPPKRQDSAGATSAPVTNAHPTPQQQDINAQLQNPNAKPNIKIPEGWICVWSKSQKRWYFFDTKTNKSVWEPDKLK